jgi:hypothetical protein
VSTAPLGVALDADVVIAFLDAADGTCAAERTLVVPALRRLVAYR